MADAVPQRESDRRRQLEEALMKQMEMQKKLHEQLEVSSRHGGGSRQAGESKGRRCRREEWSKESRSRQGGVKREGGSGWWE